jgi:hypothetical protein
VRWQQGIERLAGDGQQLAQLLAVCFQPLRIVLGALPQELLDLCARLFKLSDALRGLSEGLINAHKAVFARLIVRWQQGIERLAGDGQQLAQLLAVCFPGRYRRSCWTFAPGCSNSATRCVA